MIKKLAVTIMSLTVLLVPSTASAKWVKVYYEDSNGSTHSVEDTKIIQDQNKIYYWYRVDYPQLSATGARRVDLNVAIDCFTRQQKILETITYDARRRVIDRQSMQNGYYNPTSTVVPYGTVDEMIFNSLCAR